MLSSPDRSLRLKSASGYRLSLSAVVEVFSAGNDGARQDLFSPYTLSRTLTSTLLVAKPCDGAKSDAFKMTVSEESTGVSSAVAVHAADVVLEASAY